jgi:hypothetical protein
MPIARWTSPGSKVNEVRSTSVNTGSSPFQSTACADAANVKEGITTSPVRSVARNTNIRPAVHEATATQ